MATSSHFCLLFIFLFPLKSTRGETICDSMSCGEIDIQFPFGLKGANQSRECSYPRFQLSCNNYSQTILTLSGSGDFVVKSINYEEQTIQVNDPDGCLPKRFLQNLSFSVSSPFMFDASVYDFYDLTFLRCPSNLTEPYPLLPISCLSDPSSLNSSSVIFIFSRGLPSDSSPLHECEVISSARVPIPNPNMAMSPYSMLDLNSDIELNWNKPACGDCVARGQVCGLTRDTSLKVGCFSTSNNSKGLSRSAKYGLIIGVGIPGLLCIIGLWSYLCGKFTVHAQRHQTRPSMEFPASIITLQTPSFIMGLHGLEIEKYPKTLLGESGRLPNSNDNICPICLSEYEPKETLRTIPACNHYFHAHCIDEWLKVSATCPLCRNSPNASSTITPSSSMSIHSSHSSSS